MKIKELLKKSDVVLGDRYRDPITGLEGVATSVTFYLHACERVSLEFLKDGEVKWETFDAPRLIHVETSTQPTELGPKGSPRLSARFSEWMMGLPDGWITDVPGITRVEALKACGNGVVRQQAAYALRLMLARAAALAVAA